MENHDPLYNSAALTQYALNVDDHVNRFTGLDIDDDGLVDFLYIENSKVMLLTRENNI